MYHIAIDIGGTFTDCAVIDSEGRIVAIAKSPSTPPDFSRGVIAVLEVAAQSLGRSPRVLLAETDLLLHGCTVATNAMIERTGAVTGLITTRGHEDVIFIGKVVQKVAGLSEREIIHQSRLTKAEPPIVDPLHVKGVSERVDALGQVVVPLNEEEVRRAAGELAAQGVQSVAISFLWSFLNDGHERHAKELVRALAPDALVFASSEVAPLLGEYERTATTALNAYLGPRVIAYAHALEETLRELGYRKGLLFSHCLGGLTSLSEVEGTPLLTLDSGPAGGVLGAAFFARLYGKGEVICSDMGGTSFDVSIIRGGEPTLDEEPVLEKYTFLIPKIAIDSIGAGGGSIVWVDEDGLLRVGPQSAGAVPGPACYDQGGAQPTVTDVDLVLGYLNPDNFLGGRQRLSMARAERALEPLARALGMDRREVAAGAFKIVNAQMADLIRKTTIEQGYDPRNFALFCYGGAGPTHSPFLGRELRVREIYVPGHATVFSALGMLTGGLVHTAEASYPATLPLPESDLAALRRLFQGLEEKLAAQFRREGIAPERVRLSHLLYMKYRLQPRGMAVPLTNGLLSLADQGSLVEAFHRCYAEVYGEISAYRQMSVEILKSRVVGRCETVVPQLISERVRGDPDPGPALVGRRPAYFEQHKDYVPTRVFDGDRLRFGHRLEGPCIVERPGDTLVIPPGMRGLVDEFHNIRIEAQA
ncbi:MAG: hydantoinase/oxoprolinase family protein [Deltaproteobacteria bacterium]|nr:hydantoinase/oxoprolinase family protein [Deltaproteobacteria bacterium]